MNAEESGGTDMVPPTNGELHPTTPDPSSVSTPSKRKRGSSYDERSAEEAGSSAMQAQDKEKVDEILRNLVDILSKNDTDLQLLSCPLPSSPVKPRSKRAKTSGEKEEGTSIQSRVALGRYNTLQEFLSDIEKASTAVIERNKPQVNGESAEPVTETVNRIAAFKKLLNSLVRQAYVNQSNIKAEASEDGADAPEKTAPSNIDIRNENLVLTLFGNPSNPKQLFSSLQKSTKVPLSSDESEAGKYVEVQAPLREIGLPNGITTAKATPFKTEANKEPKRTFGEVFAPRPNLPQLEPPRRHRSSSRTAFNAWADPFEAATNFKGFLGDRNNYCLAPLPSGQWLQYGGVTSSPSFWERRQKQQTQSGEERYFEDPSLWPDEDSSLLQGVYSSFAPSFDSSGAIVQADAKDMVWWSKRGAKRVNTLLSIPYQEEAENAETGQPGNIGELDESTLEEMVKSFNPEDFADNVTYADQSKDKAEKKESKEDKDMHEVLGEVSELLETLSSYQRIRALDTSVLSKQSSGSKETATSDADTPSEAESMVYETLKSSLNAIVMTLPPYAVAKLDGDQLADLNISQKVLVENPDYRGTMEKDDFTIQQERAAAMAPAAGATRSSAASRSGSYPAGYNSRAFATNARVQQTPGNYQPYYGGRQPAPGSYTPGHPQQLSGARPPATPSQRPGYPPYSQPTPQQIQQLQRPGQNGYPYAQQAQASAQASPQPYTPRPGQAYVSPQKQPPYATPQSRAQYMTPGTANPQQRYAPQQQPAQYQNSPSNQAPTPAGYTNSAAAMTYARSAAEQAALMDRNKAQLAAHQNRQSSTPQPPVEHGNSQDRNVTPGNTLNGTPVPS